MIHSLQFLKKSSVHDAYFNDIQHIISMKSDSHCFSDIFYSRFPAWKSALFIQSHFLKHVDIQKHLHYNDKRINIKGGF